MGQEDDRVCHRVVISGRVQGVFFRETCQRLARDAGVDGWVRNRSDGRVEACFEGRADDVARLVEFCREGPPHAVVEGVEVHHDQPTGMEGFRVR